MPKGEQGFPPPGGKKYKPILLEHDARDSLAEALAEGVDDAAEERIAEDIAREVQIKAKYRAERSEELTQIRAAYSETRSGQAARQQAEAEQENQLRDNVAENLEPAKERLKKAAFKRKADADYVAARKERIEELKRESLEAMQTSKVGDRRRPRDYFEEIAAIEAELEGLKDQKRARVAGGFERSRRKATAADSVEVAVEASPEAPVTAEEPAAPEPIIVADISTDSVRAGMHATDPVKSPETPKEMRASLEEAARIFQSGEGYIDADELMRKSREQSAARAGEEAARIYQSGGDGYIETRQVVAQSVQEALQPQPDETPKPPRDPMGPNEDGKSIVMLNSILTKQALGGDKKKFNAFVARVGADQFPADSRIAAMHAPTKEGRALRAAETEREKKEQRQQRNWFAWGGALVAAGAALFFATGKKEEQAAQFRNQERPAVPKSSTEAGVKGPSVERSTDTPPPVTVPYEAPKAVTPEPVIEKPVTKKVEQALRREIEAGNLREADAQMVMAWQHMAYTKARQALPPRSDERIREVVEIIRANQDNPYAFKTGPKPSTPEAPVAAASAVEAPQAPAPRPVEDAPAPAPAPVAEGGFEVDPSSTHLYSIPDPNEPGGEALVVYGGGAYATSKSFMDKVRAFAQQHPGRTIYFDPGTPTIVDGTEQSWIATGVYEGGVFVPTALPTRPELVGMQLDPKQFKKKIG